MNHIIGKLGNARRSGKFFFAFGDSADKADKTKNYELERDGHIMYDIYRVGY